ncbi:Hypothetical predicted protein [Olea europaea subsp. europaea]|uniref:SHSP domain-containing protein n=1 Tax=Olea europaea subsp. europaea TaxID=158383 RepID=A0A8S0V849_OLEEU|nr:Hypothetical predicted protein [Olea europaea subsp. europaea]
MAATPADIKEYPNSYVFIVDMPGLKSNDIKVQVEDDNVLLISGERKRDEEKEDGVLTVTVQKLPPPEPKKPKTIEMNAQGLPMQAGQAKVRSSLVCSGRLASG